MLASDSGTCVSSAATNCLISARIAVDEAEPPVSVATWLPKKYFSSKMPRGVAMNFCVVTREMVLSCRLRVSAISRSTIADANERRDWRIYTDFADVLIGIARHFYVDEEFGIDLKQTVDALDSTTIDLCLTLFPWAQPALTIAQLYKARWSVESLELFFNWIKQNLRIKAFYGDSPNAVNEKERIPNVSRPGRVHLRPRTRFASLCGHGSRRAPF